VSAQAYLALLFALGWHFVLISLFTVGGGISMLVPLMESEFVQQYHWLDQRSFIELLAVAQAAPGPNFLIVPLLGWRIAALSGLLVALISFLAVPVTLSLLATRWLRNHEGGWVALVRRAFRPVTGGLWLASGIVLAITVDRTPAAIGITAGVTACALFFDISPLWLCLAAGALGALIT
jgi:chromate transporter